MHDDAFLLAVISPVLHPKIQRKHLSRPIKILVLFPDWMWRQEQQAAVWIQTLPEVAELLL